MPNRFQQALCSSAIGAKTNKVDQAKLKQPMNSLELKHVPIAKTGMLIRKPVADVFEAFINPDITTKFWFTKSSGRLEAGKQVQWDWEMYGISIPVTATSI